jgi:hypothetical protein
MPQYRKNARSIGRRLSRFWLTVPALWMISVWLTWCAGCGSGEKAATPQQMEQHRQQQIQRSDRERREG